MNQSSASLFVYFVCCAGQSMELKKCAEISGTGQAKILMAMKLQPPKTERPNFHFRLF